MTPLHVSQQMGPALARDPPHVWVHIAFLCFIRIAVVSVLCLINMQHQHVSSHKSKRRFSLAAPWTRARPRCPKNVRLSAPVSSSDKSVSVLGPPVCAEIAALVAPSGSFELVPPPERPVLGTFANSLGNRTGLVHGTFNFSSKLICPSFLNVFWMFATTLHETLWSCAAYTAGGRRHAPGLDTILHKR